MSKIILASTSSRRIELLSQTGLQFESVDSGYHENLDLTHNPEELTKRLAYGKARAVAQNYPHTIIIAADQVIAFQGKIYGKPHTASEQRRMLHQLNDRTHQVIVSFVILGAKNRNTVYHTEISQVRFKKLHKQDIEAYILTKESIDKAGGYAIQGLGSQLVKVVEGDYLNVVGLPLHQLTISLQELGIAIPNPSQL